MRAVHIPEVADLDGADAAKLEVLLAEADRARTQAEAILAEITHRVSLPRSAPPDDS